MPFTRPTKKPRWGGKITTGDFVDNIIANGPTGGDNIIEPAEAKKDNGWDFEEFPPRNWFNWLLTKAAHWFYWLDQQEQGHETRITLNDALRAQYNPAKSRTKSDNLFLDGMVLGVDDIIGFKLEKTATLSVKVNKGACGIFDSASFLTPSIHVNPNDATSSLAVWLTVSHAAPAANTWYHFFVCIEPGNQSSWTIKADTSITAATIQTDTAFTVFRRIGSVLTDATPEIIDFVQRGDKFLWKDAPSIASLSVTATAVSRILPVPPGVEVNAIVQFEAVSTAIGVIQYWDGILGSSVPGNARTITFTAADLQTQTSDIFLTDTAQLIYFKKASGAPDPSAFLSCPGWTDPRGRVQH